MNRCRSMFTRALAVGALLAAGAPARLRSESQPVTLAAVLRLAGAQNLAVALAHERVREARSVLEQDRHQILPWVAPGVGYRRHDGNLQDVVGNVFDASKQSGTAAVTLQAQVDFGDAIYRVLSARQAVRADEAAEVAGRREAQAAAATAYIELSRAVAAVATVDESRRLADELVQQVGQAVAAGLTFAGEASRAALERERNETLGVHARADVRVASVRLAQVLHLPATLELEPDLGEFLPVVLLATNREPAALVAAALAHRPELRRSGARVAAARTDRDGATRGPWIPTLGAQAAFGGLVGGRNDGFGHGDDFQDYGVALSWRLGPGGIGDRSRIRAADSRVRQAELVLEQERDEVGREVIEALARARAAAEQVIVAGRAVATAERLLQLTRQRKEFGVGAVLEAIDAGREYARTQADRLRAIAEHNRAQWELWRAVGDDPVSPVAR